MLQYLGPVPNSTSVANQHRIRYSKTIILVVCTVSLLAASPKIGGTPVGGVTSFVVGVAVEPLTSLSRGRSRDRGSSRGRRRHTLSVFRIQVVTIQCVRVLAPTRTAKGGERGLALIVFSLLQGRIVGRRF